MESKCLLSPSFWLCAIEVSFVHGVQIQFFKNYNYTDLVYESSSTEKCINIPANKYSYSYTTDSCLVTYWNPDCKSPYSFKKMPGNYSAPIGYRNGLESFHVCNDEDGGFQLNVDRTNYYYVEYPLYVPNVLERYTRVCTCINIPDYVLDMYKWSINNHANDVRVYFQPDCRENELGSTVFPRGLNVHTRNIYNYTFTAGEKQYKILSFGPDKSSSYFKSSCGLYDLLSQLKTNVSTLEEKLRHNDLRAISRRNEINSLQAGQMTQALEIADKFRAVNSKLDIVGKPIEEKLENVKGIIQLLNTKHDASQKGIKDLQDARSTDAMELSEKLRTVNSKLNDMEKYVDVKFEKLRNEIQHISGNVKT